MVAITGVMQQSISLPCDGQFVSIGKWEELVLCSPAPTQSALKNRDRMQLTSDTLLEEKAKKIKARDEVCFIAYKQMCHTVEN